MVNMEYNYFPMNWNLTICKFQKEHQSTIYFQLVDSKKIVYSADTLVCKHLWWWLWYFNVLWTRRNATTHLLSSLQTAQSLLSYTLVYARLTSLFNGVTVSYGHGTISSHVLSFPPFLWCAARYNRIRQL